MEKILREKLGDCKFAATSLCRTKSPYETIDEQEFYIYDPTSESNQPVRLVNETDEYQLMVKNSSGGKVCLVKTDKCLLPQEVSKCDCILTNNSRLYLVEIKDSTKSGRHKNRTKAIEQLEATIDFLVNKHQIDLSNVDANAVVCFKSFSQKTIRTCLSSKKADFREKYNITLIEGNTIEF